MKNQLIILSSLLAFQLCAEQESVSISADQVHVPLGFDSNDKKVEVIITGKLPDTCHRRPAGQVSVDGSQINIAMKADKVSGSDVYCIKAIVPYMVSVSLGQLAEGKYAISVGKEVGKTYALSVASPSSASIDNFTYANVTNVKKNQETGALTLSGEHPSNCMAVERVEMIANDAQDTFSVLPIVTKTAEECNLVMTPFSTEVPVQTASVTDAGVVFHIRRLDGTAINFRW